MAKSTVSHRLDGELLARADVYAKSRGVTRSILIEEGLRYLLALAEGGVPDLREPENEKPGPKPRLAPVPGLVRASSLAGAPSAAMAHQRKLNEAKDRASKARS